MQSVDLPPAHPEARRQSWCAPEVRHLRRCGALIRQFVPARRAAAHTGPPRGRACGTRRFTRHAGPPDHAWDTNEERVRAFSEHTAREIDAEVKRILDESLESVREILESRRDALVAVAEELIVKESMDGAELKRLVDENSSGPQLVPGTAETIKRGKQDSSKRPEGGLRSAGDP